MPALYAINAVKWQGFDASSLGKGGRGRVARPLLGQEAERAVARRLELAVRHGSTCGVSR